MRSAVCFDFFGLYQDYFEPIADLLTRTKQVELKAYVRRAEITSLSDGVWDPTSDVPIVLVAWGDPRLESILVDLHEHLQHEHFVVIAVRARRWFLLELGYPDTGEKFIYSVPWTQDPTVRLSEFLAYIGVSSPTEQKLFKITEPDGWYFDLITSRRLAAAS